MKDFHSGLTNKQYCYNTVFQIISGIYRVLGHVAEWFNATYLEAERALEAMEIWIKGSFTRQVARI